MLLSSCNLEWGDKHKCPKVSTSRINDRQASYDKVGSVCLFQVQLILVLQEDGNVESEAHC